MEQETRLSGFLGKQEKSFLEKKKLKEKKKKMELSGERYFIFHAFFTEDLFFWDND